MDTNKVQDDDSPESTNRSRRTQGKRNDENPRPTVINPPVTDLFRRLSLDISNEDKLTRAHFLEITPNKEPRSEKELVSAFMQRLLTADYKARYMTIETETKTADTTSHQHQQMDETGDVFDALLNKNVVTEERKRGPVHPMDVQMAVFHCSDSFLKQLMVTKLSQCQYALPLLVPNPFTREIEFPLWTFRQINKSWKCTDQSGKITSKAVPICEAETPMVAFFRLGSISSSKSQLINSLINERHNTFFHQHCPDSSQKSLLMDGVVEIAWYCPSGESSDHFTDCVAFCNLHGDSSTNVTQRKILTEMASVIVVFLAKLDDNDNNLETVKELCQSSTPLIVLLTDEEADAVCPLRQGKYRMRLKGINPSDVSKTLRGTIKQCLSQITRNFILENLIQNTEIKVDETNELCQTAKINALRIADLMRGSTPSLELKETFLPCQGNLWHEWCQKNKDLYRLHGINMEAESCEKQRNMRMIRWKQLALSFSELMQIFVPNLDSVEPKGKVYFFEWVRRMLDEFTSEKVSAVLQEYDEKWNDVLELKKKHERTEKLQNEQKSLENVSKKLDAITFGLEHILREMGQIYESRASVTTFERGETTELRYLAALAAELMILGYPLELMDGDAAHVPLIWVSAVLDEVIYKLGDQRVFVLSVLGIQSSGKSTLLNAMFGLQFAVSAGRCTRGAFMQLVKVSEEMKQELKFDYILVVDTEGLRALELDGLSTRRHDNELATFVVGLGNMTLINIMGENTAEMQDILQIVVHAFLRMKEVRLHPSCMFVHQNVGDIGADEKTMQAKRRLQEKLDEMTKLAVKDEVSDAEYFNDIIAFDVKKDVWYFKQLWEGSPPMAPPNPAYCNNVRELKKAILDRAQSKTCSKLSQIKEHIKNLWTALLNENFVFSFRNILEISVYRKLEEQYVTWTWTLRSTMLTVQEKFHTRINNKLKNKVQDTELMDEMHDTFQNVQQSMKSYFEDDKYEKEILDQWKGRFIQRIKNLHSDLLKQAKRELDDIIHHQEACKKLDEQKTVYEAKLFEKSKELALNFKSNITDEEEMKRQFDPVWGKWVSDLIKGNTCMAEVNIHQDIFQIVCEKHEEQLVHERLKTFGKKSAETGRSCKMYNEINQCGDYSSYVHLRKCKYKFEFTQQIRKLVFSAIHETEKLVKSKSVAKLGYNASYIQEIGLLVVKLVNEHKSDDYELKKKFTVDLLLHVCEEAGKRFADLHKQFRDSYDPVIYLETMKPAYYSVFQQFCQGATSTAVFGRLLCSKLEEPVMQSVYNSITKYLSDEMRTNIPAFNGNRSNLEKHILRSLAEQQDFEKFQTYILNPRKHFESFIKETAENYMKGENPRVIERIRGIIAHKQQCVITAAKTATEEVTKKSGGVMMWLEVFSDGLKDELEFSKEHLNAGYCEDMSDFGLLKEVLGKEITVTVQHINDTIKSLSDLKMEKFRKRPDEILIDHLCQCCWEQCPFCNAICTNTIKGHNGDHSAPFHKANGIMGWYFRDTTHLSAHICTTAVASESKFFPTADSEISVPFKEYRNAAGKYATWSITPDLSVLPYWKWFVCTFQKDLEKHYSKTFSGNGQIPDQWREYTVSDAIASLDEYI